MNSPLGSTNANAGYGGRRGHIRSALCGKCLATLRLARLLVPSLPAHVRQYACPLNLTSELPESLLQVLALPDVDFQQSVPF